MYLATYLYIDNILYIFYLYIVNIIHVLLYFDIHCWLFFGVYVTLKEK